MSALDRGYFPRSSHADGYLPPTAAIGLEEAPNNGYFPKQIQEYADRREILMKALDGLGMPYSVPHGAYFIMADASSLELPADFEYPDSFKNQPRDYKMAYFLAKTCDVVW